MAGYTIKGFDELSFIDYFGEMELPKKKKEERIYLAEKLMDLFLMVFAYAKRNANTAGLEEKLSTMIKEELIILIPPEYKEAGVITERYFLEYVALVSVSVAATTVKNLKDEWYVSLERAFDLAGNESNSIRNFADMQEAKKDGMKFKRWITMRDERVRPTHMAVDGVTIPIDDYFRVGASFMRFPHDISLGAGPEEIMNCRCSVAYLEKGGTK